MRNLGFGNRDIRIILRTKVNVAAIDLEFSWWRICYRSGVVLFMSVVRHDFERVFVCFGEPLSWVMYYIRKTNTYRTNVCRFRQSPSRFALGCNAFSSENGPYLACICWGFWATFINHVYDHRARISLV